MKSAALILAFALAGAASAALAEDTGAAKQPPPATDVQGEGTLSDKLSRNNGVIHPAEDADPGIAKAAPPTGASPMPVVPPPGTPGGDPTVKPK